MSLEQLENAILELKPDERQRLAVWFEAHRLELLGDVDDKITRRSFVAASWR